MDTEIEGLRVRAKSLFTEFEQEGGMNHLDEAIALERQTLVLCPYGHTERSLCLARLSVLLRKRYNQLGMVVDIEEAIRHDREALALHPPEHQDRSKSSNDLADDLSTRYSHLGIMEDLDEAIDLDRQALALRPSGHPDRSMSLSNLGSHLRTRYERLGSMEDLDEAIALDREALALRSPGHPDQSMSLNNLGVCHSIRYDQLGLVEDLDEAIMLVREALALRPPGHSDRSVSLTNLAVALSYRYKKLGTIEDLDEAIALDREALALCPPGHPDWSMSLKNLVGHLQIRFARSNQPEDQKESFDCYAQLALGLQRVFPADLSAARAWIYAAEEFQHHTAVLAYETSLRLLTRYLATLPSLPRHLDLFKRHTSSLAVDAFSACLRNHSLTKAVELLEQGRGVFWSQLARLRSSIDEVIASGPAGKTLADELTQLTLSVRDALSFEPGADRHGQVCNLNVQLERVVSNIRKLPGLSHSLLPSLFCDLKQAAREGPVIIVNASQYGCDALVVFHDSDPVHIPLPITKAEVQKLLSDLRTSTSRAKSTDMTKYFCPILRRLWDDVVSPIVNLLQTVLPRHSRIWWCPTAEFSLLPLHAATPFRKGQRKLADLYVSSYTPTLAALIRCRRQALSRPVTEAKRFTAIGVATAVDILNSTELANIGQRVDGLATFTRIEGAESSIARVTEELGKSDWAHFACHSIINRQQPFESAFALHDGRFTIHQILQCNLENPEFAYLSSSNTMVGDRDSPDEMIHLASAMQFAGFRSVIGTMWGVDAFEAVAVAPTFYECIKDGSGHLDHTRAALALNRTMRKLATGVPLDQRILYIHLGA